MTITSSQLRTPNAPGLAQLAMALEHAESFRAQPGRKPIRAWAEVPRRIWVQSAGSTGRPKVLRRSFESWRASFAVNRRLFDIGRKDVAATLGPLSHSLSLYGAVEALSLEAGFALLDGLRPDAQLDAIDREQVSILFATPTQLRSLLRVDQRPALPALRLGLVGGGKLDAGLSSGLRDQWPQVDWREFYGTSETSFIALADANTPRQSVGRAYPDVAVEIRDADATGMGRLWVKSPYLFDDYAEGGDPNLLRDNGWISLGEHARQDEEGHLYLGGRPSRQVNIADHLISLDALEQRLAALTFPRACLALAVPDKARGLRLTLVVEGEVDAALARALRRDCAQRFGAFAVPNAIHFLPDLPLLPAGKPDYAAARARLGLTP